MSDGGKKWIKKKKKEYRGKSRVYMFFRGLAYTGFCLLFLFSVYTFEKRIPDQIYVKEGEPVSYDFDVPVTVVLKAHAVQTAENRTESIGGRKAAYEVVCRLFGIFPVKTVQVFLVEGDAVYANGSPIGIYVQTKGILVIGTGEISTENGEQVSPAENILFQGDYIVSVDGMPVKEKEELQEAVQESGGQKEVLGVERNGETIEVSVQPVQGENGRYLLGAWVRDDLAGIGTMTYYDTNGKFGALGHAVSDSEVGKRLETERGWIYAADIIGIRRGEKGNPGELSGMISYQKSNCLGTVWKNTDIGIYGTLDGNLAKLPAGEYYPVCYKQDIRKGSAYILSCVSGEAKQYEVEIEDLDYSGREANKGIMLRVTDENLLALTGGIVQGMSGSPILQDGKIIGAVTHVFVNDPTRGYGIFIEKMLEE